MGIDCRYCHTTVEKSAFAGIPATETCMTCHSQILTDQPMFSLRTMEQVLGASIAKQRLGTLLLGIFAAAALILAGVGIYGVMAYSASQRTHEIGVRMALGATRGDVLKLVIRQGMMLALSGVALGLAAAAGLARLIGSLLFEVEPLILRPSWRFPAPARNGAAYLLCAGATRHRVDPTPPYAANGPGIQGRPTRGIRPMGNPPGR
jgi:ABC-type antimicrobial peptide transport system permease subunit